MIHEKNVIYDQLIPKECEEHVLFWKYRALNAEEERDRAILASKYEKTVAENAINELKFLKETLEEISRPAAFSMDPNDRIEAIRDMAKDTLRNLYGTQ